MHALRKHIHPGWLIIAPLLVLVVALYLGPILNILWLSVTDPEPGFGNYAKLGESDAVRASRVRFEKGRPTVLGWAAGQEIS